MLGLGPGELAIILVIVLIVFGAGKLPQVFGSLGKGVREFRDASEGKDDTTNTGTATTTTTTTTNPSAVPPSAPQGYTQYPPYPQNPPVAPTVTAQPTQASQYVPPAGDTTQTPPNQ